jgi:DNA replication protein DnaC
LLRPVFETEVLVLDDLGSVRPTDWRFDTIRLILNTRYNDSRTTVITTNFADKPAAEGSDPDAPRKSESFAMARTAARKETLGDRIGERMKVLTTERKPERRRRERLASCESKTG